MEPRITTVWRVASSTRQAVDLNDHRLSLKTMRLKSRPASFGTQFLRRPSKRARQLTRLRRSPSLHSACSLARPAHLRLARGDLGQRGRPSAGRREQQVLLRCCGIKGGLDGFTILLVQFSRQGNDLVTCCDFNNTSCAKVDPYGTDIADDAVVPVPGACVHEWKYPDVGIAASLEPWFKSYRDRGRVVLSDVPIGDLSKDSPNARPIRDGDALGFQRDVAAPLRAEGPSCICVIVPRGWFH